jgi:murein DD-endopeptidase MepM/ murein hydrolase activator NlpD
VVLLDQIKIDDLTLEYPINHGEGLMSAYSHLDKIYKSGGTWVEQGDFIGEVGKSGRVTGPHLHWSVYLKGIAINPELFLEDATL